MFKHRETPVLGRRSLSAALVSRNTIAVSAFADHSIGGDLAYFCRGVRDEIVHHLARLPSLRLLASEEPRATVEKTDPALVISGSVRRSGDRLRVTAQLVDGASGCYLWSESVDALSTMCSPHRKMLRRRSSTSSSRRSLTNGAIRCSAADRRISPRATCTCRVVTT